MRSAGDFKQAIQFVTLPAYATFNAQLTSFAAPIADRKITVDNSQLASIRFRPSLFQNSGLSDATRKRNESAAVWRLRIAKMSNCTNVQAALQVETSPRVNLYKHRIIQKNATANQTSFHCSTEVFRGNRAHH
jgi:hypothetical protein